MPAASKSRLSALLEPVVTAHGLDLEDVSVQAAGRRSVVRVVVDRDGGIDLDGVADVSRALSAVLDADDPVAGTYVLEVTSPGVDRPLTAPRHWRRNIGRLVSVTPAGGARVTGRVTAADDAAVTIDVEGTERQLPYDGLGPGRVEVEFTRRHDEEPDEAGEDGDEIADEDAEGES